MREPKAQKHDLNVKRQHGFTLLELIMVILLVAIVSISGALFISSSASLYTDNQRRLALIQIGQFAIERITRELRNALPGSVRVTADGACVEFTPIIAASNYLDNLAELSVSTIVILDFIDPDGVSYNDDQIVIAPIQASSFYPSSSTTRTGITSISAAVSGLRTITLDAPHAFPQDSPQRRLFIVESPVSICASAGLLTYYQGKSEDTATGSDYTFVATQPSPPSGGQVLAEFVQTQDETLAAIDVFTFNAGTAYRNGVLTVDLRLQDDRAGDEWLTFNQQVLLRNTP